VQAIAGTAAVILEAANVRVLVVGRVSGAELYVHCCRAQGSTGPNLFASPSWWKQHSKSCIPSCQQAMNYLSRSSAP